MEQLDTFLTNLKIEGNYSAATIKAYAGDLRRFHGYLNSHPSSHNPVSGVTPGLMIDFLEAENNSGFSPSTLQRRKMVLAQFAQYLVSVGEFTHEGVEEIHGWRPKLWQKIYQQELVVLSDGEVEDLLNPLTSSGPIKTFRDLAIVSLLLETGLSISNVIALRLEDINLEEHTISLNRGGQYQYKIPGSAPSIEKYIREERPEVTQSKEEDVLFISQLGGPISRQGGWQVIRNIGERADIAIPLSPRVLRHTAVKLMIDAGLTSREIQGRLGHTNIYSTRALIRKIKRAMRTRKDERNYDTVSDDGKN